MHPNESLQYNTLQNRIVRLENTMREMYEMNMLLQMQVELLKKKVSGNSDHVEEEPQQQQQQQRGNNNDLANLQKALSSNKSKSVSIMQ